MSTKYKGRPTRPPLETTEEQKFVRAARTAGCLCRKLNGSGQRDWPDILCLVPGGSKLLFEFKRLGEDLRPTQDDFHENAKEIGHTIHTVWSWMEAIEIVEQHYVRRR